MSLGETSDDEAPASDVKAKPSLTQHVVISLA